MDNNNLAQASWLSQNLPTTPGEQYTLTFLLVAGYTINGSFEPEDLKVFWDGRQSAGCMSGSRLDAVAFVIRF